MRPVFSFCVTSGCIAFEENSGIFEHYQTQISGKRLLFTRKPEYLNGRWDGICCHNMNVTIHVILESKRIAQCILEQTSRIFTRKYI